MVTPEQANARKEARHAKAMVKTIVLRCVLVFFTLIALILVGLLLVCNLIFNGPSESARNVLTMSMLESSGMKWFPALFIGEEKVQEIQAQVNVSMKEDETDTSKIVIDYDAINSGADAAWKDYPDGIRIEKVSGSTYNAYVMLIRDPSKVYLATSTQGEFSKDIPGTRINEEIEKQGAIAAINAGAFFDNGTSSSVVGSVPEGLVISDGKVRWNSGAAPQEGFVGFDKDNKLIVKHSMTADEAMKLNIRDGCCFGPVLLINGEINAKAYNEESGFNPRTAIGQRADGTVVFVCIDGRQAGSLGGTYADIINIMVEYGVVNGCNLDGGSSTVMLYRDRYGRYTGDSSLTRFGSDVVMINNYSLLQQEPRRMPTFFMVRPGSEG